MFTNSALYHAAHILKARPIGSSKAFGIDLLVVWVNLSYLWRFTANYLPKATFDQLVEMEMSPDLDEGGGGFQTDGPTSTSIPDERV